MDELRNIGLNENQVGRVGRAVDFLQAQGWRTDQVGAHLQQLIDEGKLQGLPGEHVNIFIQQLFRQMMGDKQSAIFRAAEDNSRLSVNPPNGAGTPDGNPPQAVNSPPGSGQQSLTPTDESLFGHDFHPLYDRMLKVSDIDPEKFQYIQYRGSQGIEVTGLSLEANIDGRLSIGSRAQVDALINNLSRQLDDHHMFASVYKTNDDDIFTHVAAGLHDDFYSQFDTLYRTQTDAPEFGAILLDAVDITDRMYGTEEYETDWFGNGEDYTIYDLN